MFANNAMGTNLVPLANNCDLDIAEVYFLFSVLPVCEDAQPIIKEKGCEGVTI